MDARLILLDPPAARREVKLSLPAIIGRSRDAKIKLVHGQVSRVHCEFFERDGVLHVRDLGSTNGTYVGEERVDESAVPPGETVTIGAVRFRAEYEPADDAILPALVHDSAATIRKTAEATFRAGAPQSAEPGIDWADQPERADVGAAPEPLGLDSSPSADLEETQFLPSIDVPPAALPLDQAEEAADLPARAGGQAARDADFPRAVEWDELELAPLDENTVAAEGPSDDESLHIFPPADRDDASPPADELKWRPPSSPESLAQLPDEAAGSTLDSASGDDDFDRFLQSLDDDKGA